MQSRGSVAVSATTSVTTTTAAGNITSGGETVLVLGPDNAIYGSVDIWGPLVNHGLVDTNHPTLNGRTIVLYCDPKVGAGDWKVTGGSVQNPNTMEIYAPVAGTGDLEVGANGLLIVHRHFSLYGTATIAGTVNVDQDVMFDVGVFAPVDCPQ